MREKSCLKHTRRFPQLHRVRLTCPCAAVVLPIGARIRVKRGRNIDFLIPSRLDAKEGAKLTGGGPPSQRTLRLE